MGRPGRIGGMGQDRLSDIRPFLPVLTIPPFLPIPPVLPDYPSASCVIWYCSSFL
jgi:hypothetical protein